MSLLWPLIEFDPAWFSLLPPDLSPAELCTLTFPSLFMPQNIREFEKRKALIQGATLESSPFALQRREGMGKGGSWVVEG